MKESGKRLIKNTLFLYVRMGITMGVSLFTSRVILNTLGIEDYGIYNVVGGFVAMFSFFTGSLSTAISRFLTFELGKGDIARLKTIFSTSVNIQLALSLFIFIVAEILGIWFLNTKLNIPAERIDAANWVFQMSILSFIINLLSVPYNAVLIAHERMSAFAYISILEAVLKLVIVYILYISPYDKLVTYTILYCLIGVIIRIVYGWYCSHHFGECNYSFVYDKAVLREMSGFAGWNLLGSGAYLFNTQGVNIITNLFFGVTVNAARGIATQVEGIVHQFVNNFTTALNPQIIKSYASGDMSYLYKLICRGAKYSYFLMFILVLPFIFESDFVLKLWLKNVPEDTALFLKLTLLGSLADILGNSTAISVWATGNIKRYYIVVGGVGCLVFPISCLLFYWGQSAYVSYIVFLMIYILLIFVKLYLVHCQLGLPIIMYLKESILRVIVSSVPSVLIVWLITYFMDDSFLRFLIICFISVIITLCSIFLFGLEVHERNLLIKKVTINRDKI